MQTSNFFLALIVFLSLYMLGSSSLKGAIKAFSLQGMCLGCLPLTLSGGDLKIHILAIASGIFILKGLLIPRVLNYALREVKIREEMEPLIGYNASLLVGAGLVGVSFILSHRLPGSPAIRDSFLLPASLSTAMMGILLMIGRLKAVTQVVGYLVFENGIYLFGLAFSYQTPWIIEMGILLDVFVAVFIMGIVIHHIARTFDSINTKNLTQLKDL